jgi:hypothetical protein
MVDKMAIFVPLFRANLLTMTNFQALRGNKNKDFTEFA